MERFYCADLYSLGLTWVDIFGYFEHREGPLKSNTSVVDFVTENLNFEADNRAFESTIKFEVFMALRLIISEKIEDRTPYLKFRELINYLGEYNVKIFKYSNFSIEYFLNYT